MRSHFTSSTLGVSLLLFTGMLAFGKLSQGFAQDSNVLDNSSSRNRLPKPDPEFRGQLGESYANSHPDFPQPISAPQGAPNVVLILLDDVGFGQAGTFGGPIPTPNLDKLAGQGLRFSRFHTTGICSPTRAALLTGRNQVAI